MASQHGAREPPRPSERPAHQRPLPPQTDPLYRCTWRMHAPLWIVRSQEDISNRAAGSMFRFVCKQIDIVPNDAADCKVS